MKNFLIQINKYEIKCHVTPIDLYLVALTMSKHQYFTSRDVPQASP